MNIWKGLKEIKDSRGADKPDNKMDDWVMRNLPKNEMIKMINKQSSREEVLKAVKVSGFFLFLASDKFGSDREIVLNAVKTCGWALYKASDELKGDREIVLNAVKCKKGFSGVILNTIADNFNDDREVIFEAVRRDGFALRYSSKDLKADREIVLAAVKSDRVALQYASKDLQDDPELKEIFNAHHY